MVKNFKNLSCYLALVSLLSCSAAQDIDKSPGKRAVFIYMAADNDLDYFAVENINQMESCFSENRINDGVYVYIDRLKGRKTAHPCLYKIRADKSDGIASGIIKVYPEQDSASADTFIEALKDVMSFSKAANEQIRGLILWSHGSAWLPSSTILSSERASIPSSRSFGIDVTTKEGDEPSEMDIRELAEKLRPFHYEFLVFDACFMSSIEVLYEIRSCFDYIIASPTEILANGFPYEEILPELLSEEPHYERIADRYVAQFNNKKGVLKSASAAVIKTSALQSFTEALKKMINQNETVVDTSTILQYDQDSSFWLFDIGQFISLFKESETKELVKELLSSMIQKYNHTEMFFNKIPLNNSSGISIYIPNNHKVRKNEHDFYKTLSWYKDAGFSGYFVDDESNPILR